MAIASKTEIHVTCDGPHCGDNNKPAFTFHWVQEEVQKDPTALPDPFFRQIRIVTNPEAPVEKAFCSALCVKDFFTYVYVTPQSPRERNEQAVQNATVEAKKLLKMPVVGSTKIISGAEIAAGKNRNETADPESGQ